MGESKGKPDIGDPIDKKMIHPLASANNRGQVFTAAEPEGVGPEKHHETAGAMIAQTELRQRHSVLPAGKTGRPTGHSVADGDAMGCGRLRERSNRRAMR